MVPSMKRFLFIVAFFTLAACASAPAPGVGRPVPPAAQTVPPVDVLPVAAFLALAGGAQAPGEADVTARFGAPDTARRDGRGVLMTWRLAPCAVIAAFADGRLSVVDVAPPASVDACFAALEARGRAPS